MLLNYSDINTKHTRIMNKIRLNSVICGDGRSKPPPDINSYSIEELYELFKNTTLRHIAGTDKERQKQVLMTRHNQIWTPTISSSKKAYDCLIRFYTEQHKITADTTVRV
jgi:hypothetical protein